jgi:hypothetical protein
MSLYHEKTIAEVLPGFYLVEGEWGGEMTLGLSTGNHPEIFFKQEEIAPPLGRAMQDYETVEKPYWKCIEKLEEQMKFSPMFGYSLIKAAKKAGYRPDRHGHRFTNWLMDKIYTTIHAEYVEKMKIENKLEPESEVKVGKKLKM